MTHVDMKHTPKYSIQLFYLCEIGEIDLQYNYFTHSIISSFIYLLNQYVDKATPHQRILCFLLRICKSLIIVLILNR